MNILSNDIMYSFNSSVYYPCCQFLKTRFTNSFYCDKNICGCSIWSQLEQENLGSESQILLAVTTFSYLIVKQISISNFG